MLTGRHLVLNKWLYGMQLSVPNYQPMHAGNSLIQLPN